MRKIPRKYAGYLIGAMMAVTMGFLMSGVVTFINLGLTHDFLGRWMHAFLRSVVVALPLALIVAPPIKSFVDKITR